MFLPRKTVVNTPILEEDVRKLGVGDIIYVTGTLVTARDAAHKRIAEYLAKRKKLPFSFDGSPLFHCGPLVKLVNGKWIVLAAGPTTSMRMEPFESEVIQKLGIRLIIGKGGMGKKTSTAMKQFGAVYSAFTGGAAVLAARMVNKVKDVQWLDLGVPDAVWTLEVDQFGPLIICMDTRGNNLFNDIQTNAVKNRLKICCSVKP
jgi:fumarate hydratase subunit beta